MRTRRQFLGEISCAGVGSTSIFSTLLNLTMANHASAQAGFGGQRKALVCVFLSGGCDTFNVLIPHSPVEAWQEYRDSRSNLAIARENLLQLNYTDPQGRSYGLHPSCVKLAELFNGMGGDVSKKRLAVMANVGTLVAPVSDKDVYLNGGVALPKALFSHRDQIEQWQTSVPQGMQVLSGWGGRAADVIHNTYNTEQTGGFYMPMNFSLSGNSAFQIGRSQGQFVITPSGALSFTGSGGQSPVSRARDEALRETVASPIEEHYKNLFQRTHGRITANSIERGAEFQQHFNSPGQAVLDAIAGAGFPDHWLSAQLMGAVKTIAIRERLKLARQTIFVEYGGWDHHAELLVTQAGMLGYLDKALYAFQKALETLGLQDDVVTFTASDFGRTLRSNGQGTDHAWSGNQFVMGGPVNGGEIYGHFPSLLIDGPDDVGRGGRIFPKLSADEMFCEMLRWFGVTSGDMDQVLPNIRNFYDPSSSSGPVGFL